MDQWEKPFQIWISGLTPFSIELELCYVIIYSYDLSPQLKLSYIFIYQNTKTFLYFLVSLVYFSVPIQIP